MKKLILVLCGAILSLNVYAGTGILGQPSGNARVVGDPSAEMLSQTGNGFQVILEVINCRQPGGAGPDVICDSSFGYPVIFRTLDLPVRLALLRVQGEGAGVLGTVNGWATSRVYGNTISTPVVTVSSFAGFDYNQGFHVKPDENGRFPADRHY